VSLGSAAKGAPIVFVHGLGVASRYLLPTAKLLAAEYPCYLPELPGFGGSAKPDHILDVPELADALHAWTLASGVRPAIMLGNSLGCQVIVEMALRHPHSITHAVLVGPTIDPARPSVLGQLCRGLLDLPRERLRFYPIMAADYFRAGPVRMYRTLRYGIEHHVERKLPLVHVPTLVVRGERDPIVPQAWAKEVTRLLPHGRLVVIPGATHVANYFAPGPLTEAVQNFLTLG